LVYYNIIYQHSAAIPFLLFLGFYSACYL